MHFLYVECECRESAMDGILASHRSHKTPVITDVRLAQELLVPRGVWNDATRGAYRAQRRKDEC